MWHTGHCILSLSSVCFLVYASRGHQSRVSLQMPVRRRDRLTRPSISTRRAPKTRRFSGAMVLAFDIGGIDVRIAHTRDCNFSVRSLRVFSSVGYFQQTDCKRRCAVDRLAYASNYGRVATLSMLHC